jgi:glycosyltransferase involved in cell wall biosynthesis
MAAKERVLVFIPAYNCARQIPRVIDQFDARVVALIDEVLVVDNRSTDQTADVAGKCLAASATLGGVVRTVVRNRQNYNLGGSHKVAFNYAIDHGFDYVVVLHGDDQGDIRDLAPWLEKGAHRTVDSLLGARFMSGSSLVNYSALRIAGNHVFNTLFSIVLGRRLYDLGSGLNAYSTKFLAPRFYLRFPNALTFNYYLLAYTIIARASLKFFPLTWREEDQMSNVRMVRQTMKMFDVLRQLVFARTAFMAAWHQPEQPYESDIVVQFAAGRP